MSDLKLPIPIKKALIIHMSVDVIKLEVQGVNLVWPMYMFELDIDKPGKKHVVLCFKSNTAETKTAVAQVFVSEYSTTGNLKIEPDPESDDMMVKQELAKLEDMIKAEENGPRDLGRYIRTTDNLDHPLPAMHSRYMVRPFETSEIAAASAARRALFEEIRNQKRPRVT
ncbi:hypothetical protein PAXRUDRAFT_18681 [Paxillus rubicundulus Ve08.2h10]|uniref:Uncharacterized protein n=1 Tax=Paxillus rubicundulus Ve08.2h10 TaxID=930991 RepID=A0A0D0CXC3_9AGAM|nr:hypothetical protein PAXRUDRAFT_18681 [Paxillus rubicundulus Ve08.2h10]